MGRSRRDQKQIGPVSEINMPGLPTAFFIPEIYGCRITRQSLQR